MDNQIRDYEAIADKYADSTRLGDPFWDDFMAHPPIVGFAASRP